MNNLLFTFVLLNTINVILQTAKSIVTIKCGRLGASVINAVAYGLYQVILVLAVCDLPLSTKVITVATANFIGVYITKTIEKRLRKDRLWKVEASVLAEKADMMEQLLREVDIPFNYIENIGKHTIFNIFCATQVDSTKVKDIINLCGAKYFVTESKML